MFQNGFDEAIHILADIDNDVIIRWAKINNETVDYQDDGTTTIDFEEPFVLKYFNFLDNLHTIIIMTHKLK